MNVLSPVKIAKEEGDSSRHYNEDEYQPDLFLYPGNSHIDKDKVTDDKEYQNPDHQEVDMMEMNSESTLFCHNVTPKTFCTNCYLNAIIIHKPID